MYSKEAAELASEVINLWEQEKEFSLVVRAIQDFLIDQNTEFHGKLETIEHTVQDLLLKVGSLENES